MDNKKKLISGLSTESDVKTLIAQCSFDTLQVVVKKLTTEFVKKMDPNPILDHFTASGVLPDHDVVKEFERNSTKMKPRDLNRWFLRNILSQGNLKVM